MQVSRATKQIPALLVLLVAALIGSSATARAQLIAFVSSSGIDTNSCTNPIVPCGSFAAAQSALLADGGTIMCLNPGFYGSLITITKSLTIDCLAGGGSVQMRQLVINAPGKDVRLRNVAVNALGFGTPVLDIVAAATVQLENVFVTGAAGVGIRDTRAGPARLTISNSSILSNTGAGIVIAPQSGSIGAVLDNVRANNNAYGVAVGVGGRVMITRSVFSWNSVTGIHADTGAVIDVNDTLVSFNQNGIVGNATVTLSSSGINSNTNGILGTTRSYGNNRIVANSNAGIAPIPVGSLSNENGLQ
jgi:hypothetical protein